MEDTQILNWEVEEEEEVEERPSESLRCSLEPLGQLRIFSSSYGPEKDFPLYLGKNMIGRMPDCSVALPFSSISKQHAVIEISAWDKAPVLRDCGSLNGTQILRPPKVLGPGMSHRLRDRELILFADLPCQYHRLDVPRPFVSRGPLTVEETPRVQGGTQPPRLLLAEDSEEEVDSLLDKCVVKGPRTSSLATVVPESDEEGPSPAPDGPGPPSAFNLNSDTDEEESQESGAGEASSAPRRGTAAETEQPKPVTAEIQIEKDQCSVKERNRDTEIERDVKNGVVPTGVILERSQPSGEDSDTDVSDESGPPRRLAGVRPKRAWSCNFIDSDTDGEDKGIPAAPAVVPMKERQIFHEAGTQSPQAPGVACRQESPADGDTDIEEGEAPLDRSQASMVIDSNTDDEEEVSAALTLARLRESQAGKWNRDPDAEEDRAQPVALLERSQASARGDSDTDVEEEGLPVGRRGMVPKGHMDREYSKKSQHPPRDSDTEGKKDESSPGVHLERSQASAQVEDEVPLGPAVALPEKHQVQGIVWTHHTDAEAEGGPAQLPVLRLEEARPPLAGDCELDVENTSSAAAGVRKSQLPAEKDAGTTWAAAIPEQDRTLATRTQGGSSMAPGEQDLLPVSRENLANLVVDTGTPREPQPQREGAQTTTGREKEPHGNRATDSGESLHDSEDLDLPATQCFADRENQSLEAAPSMEDEPTQAFLFTLPQEPGPSCCSSQATGSLNEAWEVLATQPFCPREYEASETQTAVTLLDTRASCPPPSRTAQQEQHPESPVHAEALGMEGRGMQTVEKDMGDLNFEMPPAEKASRGDQESPDACLPPAAPEASAALPNSLISQMQKHPAPQSLLFPSPAPLELPIPRTRRNESQEAPETPFSSELNSVHPEPKVRPQGSSPVSSLPLEPHPATPTGQPIALEPTSGVSGSGTHSSFDVTASSVVPTVLALQPSTSTDQPVTPKPTLGAPRGRAQRSSVKTPEPSVRIDQPIAPELTAKATRGRAQRSSVKTPKPDNSTTPKPQPSTSTDQPVTPKPTSQAPRGRTPKSSAKTPEPAVPTASELQPAAPKDQPVAPELTSRATRGRTQRSSIKTSKPDTSTAPKPQPSTSTDQPVTPKPTSRASRGRTPRSSTKTPEPVVSTASELQPSALTDQPITPELTSRATWGRAQRSSVKTPDPVTTTTPELQPSTSTDQLVTPKRPSRAPRGRTRRSSAKTPEPVVPTASELQPSAPEDQPVGPWATQCRRHRSSVKTPEPVVPTVPEPQPSTSKDQSVAPEPTSQATQSQTHRSSVKTSQPTEPTAPDLKPSSPTDQPVTPKVIAQGGPSRTRRASTASAVLVPTTPEFQSPVRSEQPLSPDPIPEVNCSLRPRATRKHGSPTAHVHEPCTTPPEPNSRSSRNQTHGAMKAAKPLSTISEPAFAQLPEAPPHTPQMPKEEAADGSGFTPEPQPRASQNRKRPSATAHSPPLQKRLQRGRVPQKAASLKEEENPAVRPRKEEGVVIPGPGKRRREQTEEESQGRPSRSLRRTKPVQESTAPKVLFTGVVDARGERTVLALGGSLASSVAEASHLVTDRIRRTVKFLCALGRGIPILSLAWLHESRKAGCFLPPDEYLVTDPEQEKNFGFSLREALSRARERRLLEGYEIHVTPGVQPPPPQMGEIINCCGGAILPSMPRSYKPQRVVITCSQDFPRCAVPYRVGLPVLSPEFLLTGVLKQEVKPEAFAFSTVEMSST
ncbi:mediator of DNA damage checkpoint protein 1 isoform X3 [Bos javanicus]|uniref:mediator of DNA damage checkpoint protein 1 isoform X3 n=1 Tax=Bos javanicus TaxID=9906 RepID=UPI002AA7413B|nr:mediator of DNA damage checkpoint protein 1 isoform X3 [Bos javanicus]